MKRFVYFSTVWNSIDILYMDKIGSFLMEFNWCHFQHALIFSHRYNKNNCSLATLSSLGTSRISRTKQYCNCLIKIFHTNEFRTLYSQNNRTVFFDWMNVSIDEHLKIKIIDYKHTHSYCYSALHGFQSFRNVCPTIDTSINTLVIWF